ncbi:MAG: toxin [Desulfobacterales bacterium]|nr:toxin [Desulfobacterales bacterium]MBI5897330.1 toxin [Desulfobacterales bacterium]
MKIINWNTEKSLSLKESRGICFEDVVFYIEKGQILDDLVHPNQKDYPGLRIMVIDIGGYAYLVPYVESDEELFLKTIIPSRKATKKYIGDKNER